MRSETNDAYRAFRIWLEMPPERREHLAAYRIYSGKPDAISAASGWFHWRNKFNWDDRAESYDDMMDRERIKARLQGVRKAERERGEKLVAQLKDFEDLQPDIMMVIKDMIHQYFQGESHWNMSHMNGLIGRATELFKLRLELERTTEKVDDEEESQTELDREIAKLLGGKESRAEESNTQ